MDTNAKQKREMPNPKIISPLMVKMVPYRGKTRFISVFEVQAGDETIRELLAFQADEPDTFSRTMIEMLGLQNTYTMVNGEYFPRYQISLTWNVLTIVDIIN